MPAIVSIAACLVLAAYLTVLRSRTPVRVFDVCLRSQLSGRWASVSESCFVADVSMRYALRPLPSSTRKPPQVYVDSSTKAP